MSANVDQRSKGQPSQVSNGNGKDVMKEDDPYLQQAPQHSVRSWSDQATDGAYGAATMSTAGVSDSFFPNYYAANMSYPFMSQGLGGSDAAWSNSADSMFSMGYDYSNVYGSFGFPFNNWEYPNDYWGGSQPVRKDQRGYAEDPYYAQEMIPTDSYGMMNGAAPPPEPQEPIGTVEQGLRGMSLAPNASTVVDSRKKMIDISQPPMLPDGFGGGDPTLMMPPSMPSNTAPGVISGGSGGSVQGSSKKTSWAAIASQPARPQQQMRPRTIPRAPVHPNKSMDIGTWDTRGNPAKSPMSMTQTLPSQPPPPRQSWTTNSVRSRQIQPHSTSGPGNVTGPSSGSSNPSSNSLNPSTNSTANSSSGNNTSSNNSNSNNSSANNSNSVVAAPSSSGSMSGGGGHPSSYANYSSSAGNSMGSRNVVASSSTTNGSHGDSQAPGPAVSQSVLDQLKSSNLYNPKEFNLNPKSARFFVIKSYSEDDIHRSIKYNIWCSTEHGNKRLDQAFREREGKGPVYLIYSVNASGHFCGIAQMMSPVDYNKMPGVWAQDKWKGQFEVKWVYVKDVPNNQLRYIRLENNENKPVTNSRDTQEVPPEKGKQVLRIMHNYKHSTSIFDDFSHYEKRQEEDQHQPQQSHQHSMHRDNRGDHHSGYNHHRDNRGGGGGGGGDHDRDNHHRNDHFRNDGRDGRGDHRYEHRGGFDRGDGREHRGGFDRDHRDRGDGRNYRDNRRGGRQN